MNPFSCVQTNKFLNFCWVKLLKSCQNVDSWGEWKIKPVILLHDGLPLTLLF